MLIFLITNLYPFGKGNMHAKSIYYRKLNLKYKLVMNIVSWARWVKNTVGAPDFFMGLIRRKILNSKNC